MAWEKKSLKDLITNNENAFNALFDDFEMPISDRKAEARVLANIENSLYNHIDYKARQCIPTTSEGEYLKQHALSVGMDLKYAAKAFGKVLVNGNKGIFIPANTLLTRASDGLEYITISDIILNDEPTIGLVECKIAGTLGNCKKDETLNFSQVIIGVESSVNVISVGAVADDETDQDLLSRYLEHVRSLYHGGAASDYRKWALEVPGVNRAWVYPHALGPGTVVVRIMTPTGFPDQVLLDKAKAHIETKRPVTATIISVISSKPRPIDVEISNLSPDNNEIKQAIILALTAELNFHAGEEDKLPLSIFNKAILTVTWLYNYRLDKPDEDIALDIGEVAILGEITWL